MNRSFFRTILFIVSAGLGALLSLGANRLAPAPDARPSPRATPDVKTHAMPSTPCPVAAAIGATRQGLEEEKRQVELMSKFALGQLQTEIGVPLPPPKSLGLLAPDVLEADLETFLDDLGFGQLVAFECEGEYPCVSTVVVPFDAPRFNSMMDALRDGLTERWPTARQNDHLQGDDEGIRGVVFSAVFAAESIAYDSLEGKRVEHLMNRQQDHHSDAIADGLASFRED